MSDVLLHLILHFATLRPLIIFKCEGILINKCGGINKYKTFSVLIYSYVNTSGNWETKAFLKGCRDLGEG
jgi:hypothetical protein